MRKFRAILRKTSAEFILPIRGAIGSKYHGHASGHSAAAGVNFRAAGPAGAFAAYQPGGSTVRFECRAAPGILANYCRYAGHAGAV